MNTGRKLTNEEVAFIIESHPFWIIESPPIVIKTYKDGRNKMFMTIGGKKYYIIMNKSGNDGVNDVWYEVLNGNNK